MNKTRALMAVMIATSLASAPFGSAAALAAGRPPTEWVIGPHKPVVMITYNGAAKGRRVNRVVRVLGRRHTSASFFLPGRWVANHHRVARKMVRGGHVLGNFGYGRRPLTSLGAAGVRRSIAKAERRLRQIGARPRPFLRARAGALGRRVLRVAGSMGYSAVSSTQHPNGGLAAGVARRVVSRARAGSIVALDLWRRSHRRALPRLIRGLRSRGFRLGTIKALENVKPLRWDVILRAGSRGSSVRLLDNRLGAISYPVGRRNAAFDYPLLQAVYAFEKAHRLARDGVVPPAEMRAILLARRPRPPRRGRRRFIDIDISRQILLEVRKRKVIRTLPISSGSEDYYTYQGVTYKAHTPRGSFVVERKIAGWRKSHLGRLYYPSYFVGGFAIHGSPSVPVYPASHGCVRIPMYAAKRFYYRNPIGRAVFVHR